MHQLVYYQERGLGGLTQYGNIGERMGDGHMAHRDVVLIGFSPSLVLMRPPPLSLGFLIYKGGAVVSH